MESAKVEERMGWGGQDKHGGSKTWLGGSKHSTEEMGMRALGQVWINNTGTEDPRYGKFIYRHLKISGLRQSWTICCLFNCRNWETSRFLSKGLGQFETLRRICTLVRHVGHVCSSHYWVLNCQRTRSFWTRYFCSAAQRHSHLLSFFQLMFFLMWQEGKFYSCLVV